MLEAATLAANSSIEFNCEWLLGFGDTKNPTINTASVTAKYMDIVLDDSDIATIQVTFPGEVFEIPIPLFNIQERLFIILGLILIAFGSLRREKAKRLFR